MKARIYAALLVLACAAPISVTAARGEGAWRHQSALQGRNNRIGIGIKSYTGYRVRLYDTDHWLLRDSYIEAGALAALSPASLKPGGYVQLSPVAPLVFRVSAQQLTYFGYFTSLHSLPEDADWSNEALDEIRHEGEYGTGVALNGMAELRLKFGPVIGLYSNHFTYLRADVDEGRTWYESTLDLLVAREDGVHAMKASLGALVFGEIQRDFLLLAARWERYITLETEVTRHIVGGVALYRPFPEWWGRPLLALIGGAFADDPYRTGEPYFGGFVQVEFGGFER